MMMTKSILIIKIMVTKSFVSIGAASLAFQLLLLLPLLLLLLFLLPIVFGSHQSSF